LLPLKLNARSATRKQTVAPTLGMGKMRREPTFGALPTDCWVAELNAAGAARRQFLPNKIVPRST
jgi:hypothetical protein